MTRAPSTIKIQLGLLVWYKADIIIIALNVTCIRHDIAEKIAHFGVKQQSLSPVAEGLCFTE